MPPEGINLDYLSPGAGAKPYFEFGLEPPRCALQCWSLEPFLKQWLLQEQLQGEGSGGGGGGGSGNGASVLPPSVGGGDSRKAAADAAAAAAAAATDDAPSSSSSPPSTSTSSSSSKSSSNSTTASSSSSSSSSSSGSPTTNGVGGALGALVKHVVAGRGGAIQLASRAWQETGMSRQEWSRLMAADAPPYAIANNNVRLPLSFRTLPTTARHHDGTLQYDAHNLYGLSQAAVTARALRRVFAAKKKEEGAATGATKTKTKTKTRTRTKTKKSSLFSSLFPSSSSPPPASSPPPSSTSTPSSYSRRPFILTRSSFLGAGAHSAHWLGDNAATWEDLRWSVTGVLESGLYGNPLPGADVCGFLFDSTPELCSRWIAAGSFHPFVRDHSDLMAANQELYRWPETERAARRSLGARYRLLPYFYTGSRAANNRGCPLARPLWFGWSSERAAVGSVASGEQWLVGDALLVSPVMRPNATEVEAYFPPGSWFDLWTGAKVVEYHLGGKRRAREDGDGGGEEGKSGFASSSVLDDRLGVDTSSSSSSSSSFEDGKGKGGNGSNSILARTSTLQAPLDHVPLHLAGGIALLSAAGGEGFVPLTTGEAWRAPLEATVALPDIADDENFSSSSSSFGGTFARCGAGSGPRPGSPHAPSGSSSRVAWGRSFRDGERGDDADALAKGSWALVSGWEERGEEEGKGGGGGGGGRGGGGVRITLSRSGNGWEEEHSSSKKDIDNCSGGPWPRLADVRVLGVEAEPDPASFRVSGFLRSGESSSAALLLKPKQVSFDAETGVLVVKGLNARLECGAKGEAAGVELRWKAKAQATKATTTSTSKKDEL